MNHDDIRHKLSDYIDDAVCAKEKTEIEEHLRSCAECGSALIELRKTVEQVREIGEIDPPAWLTNRIMAKVREESERKKSIFERLFSPGPIRFPVQAVAVLFMAVTAYFIYQNIDPAARYAKAPMEVASKKEAGTLSAGKADKEDKKFQAPAIPSKKAEQKPGHHPPDVRREYETSAPAPLREAAPSPEEPGQMQSEPLADTDAAGPGMLRGMASETARDKAERREDFAIAGKAKSAAPARQKTANIAADEMQRIRLSLSVADMAGADEEVEKIVRELGGSIINREAPAESRQLTVSVDAKKLDKLREKLGRVGELKERELSAGGYEGILKVEIMMTLSSRRRTATHNQLN